MGLCSTKEEQVNPLYIDMSHFRLLRVVGKGGFGKVHVVSSVLDETKKFALKSIEKAAILKSYRIVWRERDIMIRVAKLSPFCVGLTYAFQSTTEVYIVMKFMSGGDLRFHLQQNKKFNEKITKYYCAQLLLALEAMHQENIVHRDVKPDNMLLDEDGFLYLSDFGLAVELRESKGYRIKGNAGTAKYKSPEVFERKKYGISCDIWSFGVVMYELLHGKCPSRRKRLGEDGKNSRDKKKKKKKATKKALQKEKEERDKKLKNMTEEERKEYKELLLKNKKKEIKLRFPIDKGLSKACKSLLKRLLSYSTEGRSKWDKIKSHEWFDDIDWDKMLKKEIPPAIVPDDKMHFSAVHDLEDMFLNESPGAISLHDNLKFKGFEYNHIIKDATRKMSKIINISKKNLEIQRARISVEKENKTEAKETKEEKKQEKQEHLLSPPQTSESSHLKTEDKPDVEEVEVEDEDEDEDEDEEADEGEEEDSKPSEKDDSKPSEKNDSKPSEKDDSKLSEKNEEKNV